MDPKGTHITLDIWFREDVPCSLLEGIMDGALAMGGVTVLQRVRHLFKPQGLTALWLLAESHASLHTYPERRYCSMDIYTCGAMDPMAIARNILRAAPPIAYHQLQQINRGRIKIKLAPVPLQV